MRTYAQYTLCTWKYASVCCCSRTLLLRPHPAIVHHIIMQAMHCSTSGRHGCPSNACVRRTSLQRLRPLRVTAAASGSSEAQTSSTEPMVRLIIKPSDGSPDISVDCPSGEQLRYCLLDNKVDLYTTWGKIWSCGGAGQCGTCIVQVTEGADLLSDRNATELKKLKGKPESWRLACQTLVGDGTNSGQVTLVTKPQGK